MLRGLEAIEDLVEAKRYYEALRKIRTLFDIEQSILAGAELARAIRNCLKCEEDDMNVNSATNNQPKTDTTLNTPSPRWTTTPSCSS